MIKEAAKPYRPASSLILEQGNSSHHNANKSNDLCEILTNAPPAVYVGVGVGLAIGAVIIGGVALTASAPVSVPAVLTSLTLLAAFGVAGNYVGQKIPFNPPENSTQKPSIITSKPSDLSVIF